MADARARWAGRKTARELASLAAVDEAEDEEAVAALGGGEEVGEDQLCDVRVHDIGGDDDVVAVQSVVVFAPAQSAHRCSGAERTQGAAGEGDGLAKAVGARHFPAACRHGDGRRWRCLRLGGGRGMCRRASRRRHLFMPLKHSLLVVGEGTSRSTRSVAVSMWATA